MRSDFYSLPWAAQQAIRRGERDASIARHRAYSMQELRAKVDELETSLTAANAKNAEAATALERACEALTAAKPFVENFDPYNSQIARGRAKALAKIDEALPLIRVNNG